MWLFSPLLFSIYLFKEEASLNFTDCKCMYGVQSFHATPSVKFATYYNNIIKKVFRYFFLWENTRRKHEEKKRANAKIEPFRRNIARRLPQSLLKVGFRSLCFFSQSQTHKYATTYKIKVNTYTHSHTLPYHIVCRPLQLYNLFLIGRQVGDKTGCVLCQALVSLSRRPTDASRACVRPHTYVVVGYVLKFFL